MYYDGSIGNPRKKKRDVSAHLPKTSLPNSPKTTPQKKAKPRDPNTPSADWSKVTSRYLEPKSAVSLLNMTAFSEMCRWNPQYVVDRFGCPNFNPNYLVVGASAPMNGKFL